MQKINIKKYTKEQMLKMLEEAAEKQEAAEAEAAEAEAAAHFKDGVKLAEENEKLRGQIDQMNGEAINKANVIANLKADGDVLRNKLNDTEAALKRANDDLTFKGTVIDVMRNRRYNAEQRDNYAESHLWRNMWAWFKREAARHE